MKILLVHDYATPTGGAELQMLGLREGLRRRGHDARLFSTTAGSRAELADERCFGTTSSFRTLLQTANPWAYGKLKAVLEKFHPDVVQVTIFLTQLSPLILPLLEDVPSLYYAVWYRSICPLGTKMLPDGSGCHVQAGAVCYRNGCLPLRDWVPLMLQLRLFQRWGGVFRMVAANSEAVRKRLEVDGVNATEVVWPGTPVVPRQGEMVRDPVIVFAGRLMHKKGADVLVGAFAKVVAQVPGARLLIAGDGPEREALLRLIAQLKLESTVSILGQRSREEVERAFDGAWIQVVPSRWEEPFGLVATESMMRGRPVVASDCGGLSEIIQNGKTGLLVPPGDAEKLAAALLSLINDRSRIIQMGRAAREVAVTQFSEDTSVEKFLKLYESLL